MSDPLHEAEERFVLNFISNSTDKPFVLDSNSYVELQRCGLNRKAVRRAVSSLSEFGYIHLLNSKNHHGIVVQVVSKQ